MALIQDPETKRKEAEERLKVLLAQQDELKDAIKQAQRESKGIADVAPGVVRARDVLFVDFDEVKFGEVKFDYALDPEDYNEASFYASCANKFSELQWEIDSDESCKIEDAIAKSKLWMDAYTAMYNFFTEHKDKGIRYVHVNDNSSTAEKFEFDNDPNATKPKARKRK